MKNKFRALLTAIILVIASFGTISATATPVAALKAESCYVASGITWGAWTCYTYNYSIPGQGIYRAIITCKNGSNYTQSYGPWRNLQNTSQANCLIGTRYGPPSIERI